jgi:acyl carrier protein
MGRAGSLSRRRVEELLRNLLVKDLGIDAERVRPDASITSLGLDSLDLVEVAQGIERGCGIRIRAVEAVRLRTVDDVVEHVLSIDASTVAHESVPPPVS